MAYDWAKLWIEMLDDRKTASLPDSAWRRFVECILLAMEVNQGGRLPSVQDMAWRLRVTPETMGDDMTRLALSGLVELDHDDIWKVTNFVKRQSAIPMAERVASHRERAKKKRREGDGGGNGNVTVTSQKRDSNEHVTKSYTDKIRIDKNRLDEIEMGDSAAAQPQHPSRAPIPQPSMTANLHPAVKAMYQVTTIWPGEITHPIIIEAIGDAPDIEVLGKVYAKWVSRGYNPRNYEGICGWYQELKRNPRWTPQATNGKTQAPAESDGLWQKALNAITAGQIDDERLKSAIKAIGGSSAIRAANEFTTGKLKERLYHEYTATPA